MVVRDRRRAPVPEPVAEAAGSQFFQPGEDRVGFGPQLARDPDDPGNGLADLESAGPGQDGGDGEAGQTAQLRRFVGVAGLLRCLGLAEEVVRLDDRLDLADDMRNAESSVDAKKKRARPVLKGSAGRALQAVVNLKRALPPGRYRNPAGGGRGPAKRPWAERGRIRPGGPIRRCPTILYPAGVSLRHSPNGQGPNPPAAVRTGRRCQTPVATTGSLRHIA